MDTLKRVAHLLFMRRWPFCGTSIVGGEGGWVRDRGTPTDGEVVNGEVNGVHVTTRTVPHNGTAVAPCAVTE